MCPASQAFFVVLLDCWQTQLARTNLCPLHAVTCFCFILSQGRGGKSQANQLFSFLPHLPVLTNFTAWNWKFIPDKRVVEAVTGRMHMMFWICIYLFIHLFSDLFSGFWSRYVSPSVGTTCEPFGDSRHDACYVVAQFHSQLLFSVYLFIHVLSLVWHLNCKLCASSFCETPRKTRSCFPTETVSAAAIQVINNNSLWIQLWFRTQACLEEHSSNSQTHHQASGLVFHCHETFVPDAQRDTIVTGKLQLAQTIAAHTLRAAVRGWRQ